MRPRGQLEVVVNGQKFHISQEGITAVGQMKRKGRPDF
jgi:hypothetical protein